MLHPGQYTLDLLLDGMYLGHQYILDRDYTLLRGLKAKPTSLQPELNIQFMI